MFALRPTPTFTQSPSSSRLWMTKLKKLEIHSGLKEVVSTLWLVGSWPVCLGRTQGGQGTARIFHTLEKVFSDLYFRILKYSQRTTPISISILCIWKCDFENWSWLYLVPKYWYSIVSGLAGCPEHNVTFILQPLSIFQTCCINIWCWTFDSLKHLSFTFTFEPLTSV